MDKVISYMAEQVELNLQAKKVLEADKWALNLLGYVREFVGGEGYLFDDYEFVSYPEAQFPFLLDSGDDRCLAWPEVKAGDVIEIFARGKFVVLAIVQVENYGIFAMKPV